MRQIGRGVAPRGETPYAVIMSTHRLFVALRPPPPVRALLLRAMHGISGARWQSDEQLHLTLRFIGEVDHHLAEDIAAVLGALHAPAARVRIAGVDLFERQGRPHMVWARIAPEEPLAALHRKVEQCLARVGIAAETRAFVPHVTLARLNRSSGPVAPFLALNGDLASDPFLFDHVTLYESEMGHGGSRSHLRIQTVITGHRVVSCCEHGMTAFLFHEILGDL